MTSKEAILHFEYFINRDFVTFLESFHFQICEHFNKIDDFAGYSDFKFKRNNQFILIGISQIPQDYDIGIHVSLWADNNYSVGLPFAIQYLTKADNPKKYDYYQNRNDFCMLEIKNDLTKYLYDFLQGDNKTYQILASIGKGLK